MSYNFVHLHNHTEYSLLDGMLNIEESVDKAKSLGMKALAITDHGNMYGAIEFYKECKKKGIKPIVGSEFYVSPDISEKTKDLYHLILLAKSDKGYKNLIKLSSISYVDGFYYKPRIDNSLLEKYSEGLICLSACIGGEIPQYILQDKFDEAKRLASYYKELFGNDSFFLEIQYHGLGEEKRAIAGLSQLSRELMIPLVATNDAHYLDKEDYEAHDALLCIGTKKLVKDTKRLKFPTNEFYLKTEEEMARLFAKDFPMSLSNSCHIAEMCELDIELPGPILPDFDVPSTETKDSYLKKIAIEGLSRRYPLVTDELMDRLNYEIDVISRMGFAGYFLIVWDFIRYAKMNDIWVGPGRGSGAGSIVAYSLEITNIDPIKYNLLFERFLNEKRISMPDFDIDFCQERREEVIDYVNKKYTKDKVSQIVTFSKMKSKAVLRDVGRVLDIPLDRVNYIVSLFKEFYHSEGDENSSLIKYARKNSELNLILEGSNEDEKKLIFISERLRGITRHTSIHAAGVVIGKSDITDFVPLQVIKDDKIGDIITTQFQGPLLEECGLVKMDFLGLITLTVIRNCLATLEKKGIVIDIDKIDLNDQKVYEVFANGETDAIFQFESPGMKKYLTKLKPTCLEDLIAMNALYRPGPMQFIDTYIARKHKREEVFYDHPSIEPILAETYGIMVYQEQVMMIAQVLAGYDLGAADILRRAMGKKKAEEMEMQLDSFVAGSMEKGVEREVAVCVFKKMSEFANYGFNKSHATAYAYLAYQTAYLKAYYPLEFMASILTSEIRNNERVLNYIDSMKAKGIKILPPDVNSSSLGFIVEGDAIRYALNGIKGVGENATNSIISARNRLGKFTSFLEFLESVDLRLVNKNVLEIFIKCGAFDSMGERRKYLFSNFDLFIKDAQNRQADKKAGQTNLFDDDNIEVQTIDDGSRYEEWTEKEKQLFEKEYLGFYVSSHPLKKYRNYIKKNITYSSSSVKDIFSDTNNSKPSYNKRVPVIMAGIIDNIKFNKLDNGSSWAILDVEDLEGKFSVTLYSNEFQNNREFLNIGQIIFIRGYVKMMKNESAVIVGEGISDLEERRLSELKECHVFIKNCNTDERELNEFKNELNQANGELSLFFHLKDNQGRETIIKSADIKVPKDELMTREFVRRYDFIENIKNT